MQARTTAADDGTDDAQTETEPEHVRTETFELVHPRSYHENVDWTANKTVTGSLLTSDSIDLANVPQSGDRVEITYKYREQGEQFGEHGEKTRTGTVTHCHLTATSGGSTFTYIDDESEAKYSVSDYNIRRERPPRRYLGTPQEITVHYTESPEERRAKLLEYLREGKVTSHTSVGSEYVEETIEHNEGLQESEGATFAVEADLWGKEATYDFDTLPEANDLAEHINGLDHCSATVERQEVSDQ